MINLDFYVTSFISLNWISLSLALGILKVIAKLTPNVHDDSIITMLSGVFSMVRGGNGLKNGKPDKGVALND